VDPDTAGNLGLVTLVESLSPAARSPETSDQSPGDVAFSVTVDNGEPATVLQAFSPDRDYLWLDPVFDRPISLSEGIHTLKISYAGELTDRISVVDAFLFIPAVLCKSFQGESLTPLSLCYYVQTGETTWEE
jgi:hypothetical protein